MKAGIITHYDVHNHGAQLQLYALMSQLKLLGVDAKALRYKKNFDFLGHNLDAKYNISIRSVPIYAKYLLKNGLSRTIYNVKKRKLLNSFRENNNIVGEYYSESKNLNLLVIGSDEIFSIEPGLNPCFWGMGVPCDKVISYAGSFGPTTMSFIKEHYAEEFIRAGINRINNISVRDKNSYDIIKSFSDKDVAVVCDPVLMYDFSSEKKHFTENNGDKYCIVYSYDNNMNDNETINAINEYAKKRKLKVYSIGYYHKWCDKNINVSPVEILNWFNNAECVFTDTFHGTVISLVTNAQFFTKIGSNKNKLGFLLEQYGVSNRRVNSFRDVEKISIIPVDYNVVNETIKKIRENSIQFLRNAIMGEM